MMHKEKGRYIDPSEVEFEKAIGTDVDKDEKGYFVWDYWPDSIEDEPTYWQQFNLNEVLL